MTVREVLEAARDAAIEIRRIEDEAEIRRESVGVQGHTYGFHPKNGILDPSRKIVDLIDWQESQIADAELERPITEAGDVIAGLRKMADPMTIEVITRYYLEGETFKDIIDGDGRKPALTDRTDVLDGIDRTAQFRYVQETVRSLIGMSESIGIARLKELGRS